MKKRAYIVFTIVALIYVISYLFYRTNKIEVWSKDQKPYVIFPKNQKWVYYAYRPLTYIDSKVTGMRFHIGPHQ